MKEVLLLLMMFWNVENYFDTFNNPATADDEFTPRGEKFWSRKKFEKKRDDIARTIMLVAERYGKFPAIIGLCEVENSYVLDQLTRYTPLAKIGYRYIHRDSPDSRGIDVALLYLRDFFLPDKSEFYPLLQGGDTLSSRMVQYTRGLLNGLDTLHIFINHWPSKLGGDIETLPKRMVASDLVKSRTDSILMGNPGANIIVMGDFNDTPSSLPMKNLDNLVNLSNWGVGADGTHKYKGCWEVIDQILVSENLMWEEDIIRGRKWIYTYPQMDIFAPHQLLQRDDAYLGEKLRKTYNGPRYLGGISDHLPVLIKICGVEY